MQRITRFSGWSGAAAVAAAGMLAMLYAASTPVLAATDGAQQQARRDYQKYCASCHGPEGRGDGPVAQAMKAMPADLTLLSMNNDGKYPAEKVRDIIDGRADVKAHGPRAMPVWGDEFYVSAEGVGQRQAHDRIEGLTDYLRRMQKQ
jgi:mono/diheme cytochrome c family protein